jgi:hypothetical protein
MTEGFSVLSGRREPEQSAGPRTDIGYVSFAIG